MFDICPEVRAETARAGLALPGLDSELTTWLWDSLLHSLIVAGRVDEALAIEPKDAQGVLRQR